MILLAASIVALLFVLACSLGGIEGLTAHGDLPALLGVLGAVVCFVFTFGYKKFRAGLSAVLYRPKEPQPEIAECFRKLALSTLALMIVSFSILRFIPDYTPGEPVQHHLLMSAIFIVVYSGWLALLFFMPMANRHSGGTSNTKYRLCLIASALLGIVALLAIGAGTCMAKQIPIGNVLQEIADTLNTGRVVLLLLDFPSLVLVLATIGACRLGMGKVQNQHDWIPVCLFIGILWTLNGMVLMLANFSPEHFVPGLLVASLTTLYACLFALAALARIFWIAVIFVSALTFVAITWMLGLMLLLWVIRVG